MGMPPVCGGMRGIRRMGDTKQGRRPDREGAHRTAFEKNKRRVLAAQSVCGICGKPVDKSLKFPHPLSACIDHIIPIDKGGHPSDLANLQLAHMCCNRQKSNKLTPEKKEKQQSREVTITNRNLPLSLDWTNYRATTGQAG